ncbi:MAG: YHS domain-containing (seleno)protein [Bacteriovoracia bacterium]
MKHIRKISLFPFLMVTLSLVGTVGRADEVRNAKEYNLSSGLGLKGYDPVAVFPEGGGRSLPGKEDIALEYKGVVYRFANLGNADLFKSDPDKYEPTYGGWCAYAMASGSKVDIQPDLFTVHGKRAHYFVAARAKANFDRDVAGHEDRADAHWMRISGESPRNAEGY